MLTTILWILIILVVIGWVLGAFRGGYGSYRYGYSDPAPIGLAIVVVIVLLLVVFLHPLGI